MGKAVVSPPVRPLRFSPLKSAATVIKKGEPPLSAVQRDRTQDETVTAVDIISPAAPGPAEETGDPFATDVQSEHGEALLTDAVPHERPETSELKPIDPVTAAEEPTSNEFQELESEGLFLVGSPFEVVGIEPESSSPELSDAFTDTELQGEIDDTVPANEVTAALPIPAAPGKSGKDRPLVESELHVDGMVNIPRSGSPIVASESEEKPDNKVYRLDIASGDTDLCSVNQDDSVPKLAGSRYLSTDEAHLPKDVTDDSGNDDVCPRTEGNEDSDANDNDANELASSINEKQVNESKYNEVAPLADRFVNSAYP